jgi:hypothetical protein
VEDLAWVAGLVGTHLPNGARIVQNDLPSGHGSDPGACEQHRGLLRPSNRQAGRAICVPIDCQWCAWRVHRHGTVAPILPTRTVYPGHHQSVNIFFTVSVMIIRSEIGVQYGKESVNDEETLSGGP